MLYVLSSKCKIGASLVSVRHIRLFVYIIFVFSLFCLDYMCTAYTLGLLPSFVDMF